MEVTWILTPQKQSSSLMVSYRARGKLPPGLFQRGTFHLPVVVGTTPEYPSSHWEGGEGAGFPCTLGLFLCIKH